MWHAREARDIVVLSPIIVPLVKARASAASACVGSRGSLWLFRLAAQEAQGCAPDL